MMLEHIPQILPFLLQEGVISKESKEEVEDHLRALKNQGVNAFTGDLAVSIGVKNEKTGNPLSQSDLLHYLGEQVTRKAEAAVDDIQTIAESGKQPAPPWLKANWGNNGVNHASDNSTIVDGVAAAANIAQNLVMLANEKPELAKELKSSVSAAANLARGIMDGDSFRVPLATKGSEWVKEVEQSLREGVQKSDTELSDNWGGQIINLDEFISERFKEIQRGIQLSLIRQQQKGQEVFVNVP
jgi:hypothetical protein